MVSRVRAFWKALRGRSRMEVEMDAELRFHMEAYAEDLVRSGVPRAEAERQARLEFGGVEPTKEDCRQALGLRLVDEFQQDVRYAVRSLRRSPGFTAVAVITLALGIGATTAIFSFVDATMLRPLPFRDVGRLVEIHEPGGQVLSCTLKDLRSWRQNRTFSGLAVQAFTGELFLNGPSADSPRPILTAAVTANYFEVLGIHPALGRPFLPEENEPGKDGIAMLSNKLWRSGFGSDAGILGKAIYLSGRKCLVVGVLPPGILDRMPNEVYVPLVFGPETAVLGRLIGRLKPGVSRAQASADITPLFSPRILEKFPGASAKVGPLGAIFHEKGTLVLLFGAVLLVLLIACGNVANLLVARAAARSCEVATRLSLGAGRLRLVRQFLTESFVLAAGGGLAGVLLCISLVKGLKAILPARFLPGEVDVVVDLRVLLFVAALSLSAALLLGLAPAHKFGLPRFMGGLQRQWGDVARHAGKEGRLLRAVLVLQVALAFVLASGAGLMANSLARLMGADPGFQAAHLVTGRIRLSATRYPSSVQRLAWMHELGAKLRAIPSVRSVTVANAAPFSDGVFDAPVTIEGQTPVRGGAMFWMVSPELFETMELRLLRGRWLSALDGPSSARVVAVDLGFAREYFPVAEPLGQRIRSPLLGEEAWHVVGVVTSVMSSEARRGGWKGIYLPLAQLPPKPLMNFTSSVSFIARVEGEPSKSFPAIRSIVASMEKNLAVSDLGTLEDRLEQVALQPPRFRTTVFASFALLALVLAVVGIYGVFQYSVVRRTREIGVRMALGARAGDVVRMVMRQGVALALKGIAIGTAGAALLAFSLSRTLFGVKPADPATFIVVTLLVIAASGIACYLPARRASRIDPMGALRNE